MFSTVRSLAIMIASFLVLMSVGAIAQAGTSVVPASEPVRLAQATPHKQGEENKGREAPSTGAAAQGAAESTAPGEDPSKSGDGGAAAGSDASGAEKAASALPAAATAQLEEFLQPVRRIGAQLEDLEKTVERVKERDDELAKLRPEIDKLPGEARAAIAQIEPRLHDIRAQIEKLGPGPKSGEAAESAEVAAERSRLVALATQLDGAIRSAELNDVKARQLIDRLQEYRQKIFAEQVLRRTKHSPLKPALWQSVAQELPRAAREIAAIAEGWWQRTAPRAAELIAIISLSLLVYLGLRLLRRRVELSRLGRPDRSTVPSFFERAAVASWVAPARMLPGVAAVLILYFGLDSSDLIEHQTLRFGRVLLKALLVGFVVFGLSWAILQPTRSTWRLVDLTDQSARRLNLLMRIAAIIYGIDLVMRDVIKMLYLPFQVSVAQAFLFSLAFAALLFALARMAVVPRTVATAGQAGEAAAEPSWRSYSWFRVPLVLLALFIAAAALSGFVALARIVSVQVLLTGTVVVLLVLLHLAIRAVSGDTHLAGEDEAAARNSILAGRFGFSEERQRQFDRVLYLILNFALAFAAAPLLLATWGFSAPEIVGFVKSAVFGFEISGVRISPTRILLAIGLFVAVVFVTRLLQRWLRSTVLQPSRVDAGLANSIHTGVGYAGFALAALSAISYGGIDITNLAIVAGALSVGIGFGLQSIVNNFVSGLILLVERPIKVGDWIGVGEFEGHVRRISVRSTEIETFDRSSVIVPNSQLISGTVKNRTHRNALGRVDVAVGVSYKADPDMVKALLEKVAQESPMVLKFPAPVVSFDNFAASSLDFTVRAYVADVNKSVVTATDLRLRVFKALHEAGIEIPFPQHDVHLRDLDLVKTLLARMAEERVRKAAEAAAARTQHSEPDDDARRPRGLGKS